jgi:hypothetical protein
LAHYRTLAGSVGIPIILYNFPWRAGTEVGYEVLDGLIDQLKNAAPKYLPTSRFISAIRHSNLRIIWRKYGLGRRSIEVGTWRSQAPVY